MSQLKMERDDTPVTLVDPPQGYYLRPFVPGDEEAWCRCCIGGELGVNEASVDEFTRVMASDERVDTGNIFFIVSETGGLAGTATYQYGRVPSEGYVHMVSVAASHRGKGLARPLVLYTVDRILREGNKSIVLTTDDWRLPAIKTYLNCGFTPCVTDETAARWLAVLAKL